MSRPLGMSLRYPKEPCVYILANRRDGTLYAGVTSEVFERVALHKQNMFDGFTKKYKVHCLVYVEFHDTMAAAILREKRLKKRNRAWKVRIIQEINPQWIDLWQPSGEILTHGPGGLSPPDPTEVQLR